jgi:hypothetical protein
MTIISDVKGKASLHHAEQQKNHTSTDIILPWGSSPIGTVQDLSAFRESRPQYLPVGDTCEFYNQSGAHDLNHSRGAKCLQ